MKSILPVIIIIFLSSCGPAYKLKRAEKLIKKAEALGAVWSVDTVYIEKSIVVPEIKTDTVFRSEPGDTVRIEKERLKIKYVNLPGDSVYIEGKCESDTIFIKTPVTVTKEIKAEGWLKWWYLIIALIAGWFISCYAPYSR